VCFEDGFEFDCDVRDGGSDSNDREGHKIGWDSKVVGELLGGKNKPSAREHECDKAAKEDDDVAPDAGEFDVFLDFSKGSFDAPQVDKVGDECDDEDCSVCAADFSVECQNKGEHECKPHGDAVFGEDVGFEVDFFADDCKKAKGKCRVDHVGSDDCAKSNAFL